MTNNFFIKFDYMSYTNFLRNYWITNITLTNGLSLIHPVLVYILYIYILKMNNFKYNINCIFIFKNTIDIVFKINLMALLLGSWWAEQELNWGGWWNWDFVELILLIFILKAVNFVHNTKKSRVFYIKTWMPCFYIYFYIFFIFVRWDVLNSIHSFNTLSFLEKYSLYVVITLSFFIFLYINKSCEIKYYLDSFVLSHDKFKSKNYINIVFNFIVWIILIIFFLNVYLTLIYENDFVDAIKNFRKLFILLFTQMVLLFFKKMESFVLIVFFVDMTLIQVIYIACFLMFVLNKNMKKNIKRIHKNISVVICLIIIFNLKSYVFVQFYKDIVYNSIWSVDLLRLDLLKHNLNYNIIMENVHNFNSLKSYNFILYFNSMTSLFWSSNITKFISLNILVVTFIQYFLWGLVLIILISYSHNVRNKIKL